MANKKSAPKEKVVESNSTISPKQVVVSIIILLFAIGLLVYAFSEIFNKKEITKEELTQQVIEVKDIVAEPVSEEAIVKEEVVEIENHKTTLNFNATTDSEFEYEIFYTTQQNVWFTPEKAFTYKANKGSQAYSITLPETKVYRIRLDFGSNPIKITLKDIHLSGEQNVELNDFDKYEYNDIQTKTINEDGSITIISEGRDPYIAYKIE